MKDLLTVVLLFLVLSVAVLIVVTVIGAVMPDPARQEQETRNNLDTRPTMCYPYYNDGTERWANCMGVGYVHN